MKYIRTKEGIYEVVGFDNECIIPSKLVKVKTNGRERITHCCDTDIIKEADTIEELCDEFVIEYRDGSKFISIHDNTDKFLIEHKDEIESGYIKNVYGAIWTSKGLIYVAKMNSEGKLVLI